MERIVTVDEMRWCDETTIAKAGVPGLFLMEHAGKGVVEVLKQHYAPLEKKHVCVCCGKGNNGGDGFVVARLVSQYCAHVTVVVIPNPSEIHGDAQTNFHILRTYAKVARNITIVRFTKKVVSKLTKVNIIVDAIFGTGFSGTVQKRYAEAIEWITSMNVPVVAVDIPSGVNGTTGRSGTPAIRAERTVTFAYLKTGLLCNEGRERSGQLHVVDIGIPANLAQHSSFQYSLIEPEDVRRLLPKRSVFAHKYSVGKVLVIAGSKGLTGAAAMCSLAAFRSGAGAVILATPDQVYPILAKKLTEVMVYPVPSTTIGTIALEALNTLSEKLKWADVVIIGPGLGQHPETQEFIIQFMMSYKGNVVVDADGLNNLAAGAFRWSKCSAMCILTPHVGEFSRLTKLPVYDIETYRLQHAQQYAKRNNVVLLLKGVPTVTASPSGEVIVNSTGNPGMATAGAGDILAGIIGGLWAQGMEARDAAACAAYLHGAAGDCAAAHLGEKSMLATDILKYLPNVLASIERIHV